MRDLTTSDKNEINIYDVAGGGNITFYHKTIVTTDHLKYRSKLMNLAFGGALTEEAMTFQVDYTLQFITGFSDNHFLIDKKKVSSNPESKNYYKDWKGMLKESCGDLLLAVNEVLFEKTNYHLKKNSPLLKSLKNTTTRGQKKKKKST